ncbi:MAG: hypothetical protein L6Q68_20015, partial [Aquabacterium sp.]|nr:hypothetical protein [Aquabacterium sp.]
VGVGARFLQRGPQATLDRSLDTVALLVATILPLLLASGSAVGGLVQRVMFAVAYLWFGREALVALGKQREPNAAFEAGARGR